MFRYGSCPICYYTEIKLHESQQNFWFSDDITVADVQGASPDSPILPTDSPAPSTSTHTDVTGDHDDSPSQDQCDIRLFKMA